MLAAQSSIFRARVRFRTSSFRGFGQRLINLSHTILVSFWNPNKRQTRMTLMFFGEGWVYAATSYIIPFERAKCHHAFGDLETNMRSTNDWLLFSSSDAVWSSDNSLYRLYQTHPNSSNGTLMVFEWRVQSPRRSSRSRSPPRRPRKDEFGSASLCGAGLDIQEKLITQIVHSWNGTIPSWFNGLDWSFAQ